MTINVQTSTYSVTLGGVTRDLKLVKSKPNTRLALVELLGDTELTNTAAREIQNLLPADTQVLFTCETSSIPLLHALSERTGLPYEVARKRRRPYMNDPFIQDVASMTMGVGETLWLDVTHAEKLKDKRVAIVLDVVSSGGTLQALEKLVTRSSGVVVGRLAAFSQGVPKMNIVAVQELPIFDVTS